MKNNLDFDTRTYIKSPPPPTPTPQKQLNNKTVKLGNEVSNVQDCLLLNLSS